MDQNNIIISIVAVVAILGIFFIISENTVSISENQSNLAGQAIYREPLKVLSPISEAEKNVIRLDTNIPTREKNIMLKTLSSKHVLKPIPNGYEVLSADWGYSITCSCSTAGQSCSPVAYVFCSNGCDTCKRSINAWISSNTRIN